MISLVEKDDERPIYNLADLFPEKEDYRDKDE